jgi:hypothetical protein
MMAVQTHLFALFVRTFNKILFRAAKQYLWIWSRKLSRREGEEFLVVNASVVVAVFFFCVYACVFSDHMEWMAMRLCMCC